MKIFNRLSLAALLPFFVHAAEFDSTVHFQVGTNYPEENSHMKLTGNLYDFIPNSSLMWVVSPKVYFNPSVPVDFSLSTGLKMPVNQVVMGYHLFGHFHNLGDFPVNQYGHTVEFLHDLWEAKINYYHPASGISSLSTGIKSPERLDSEFTVKTQNAAITLGPIYEIQNQQWGILGRVAMLFETADVGIEVQKMPSGAQMTSLFTTLKFPNKVTPKISPKGNSSSHYTQFSVKGPTSYSTSSNEELKKLKKAIEETE
jgi:hypothetical protein